MLTTQISEDQKVLTSSLQPALRIKLLFIIQVFVPACRLATTNKILRILTIINEPKTNQWPPH